jgi:ElaB/YqjD/DUF883 family membrane-anchored ribosome-binding protein
MTFWFSRKPPERLPEGLRQERRQAVATHDLYSEVEGLRKELDRLSRTLNSFLEEEGTKRHSQLSRHASAGTRFGRLGDTFGHAGELGRKAVENVQTRIEDHPFGSIATAFGVGVLVAVLLNRAVRH